MSTRSNPALSIYGQDGNLRNPKFQEPGTYLVTIRVPLTDEDEVGRFDTWDWQDLVGVNVEFVSAEREKRWQPMTLNQIKAYLAGHLASDLIEGQDYTEVRETEHGVEYR